MYAVKCFVTFKGFSNYVFNKKKIFLALKDQCLNKGRIRKKKLCFIKKKMEFNNKENTQTKCIQISLP